MSVGYRTILFVGALFHLYYLLAAQRYGYFIYFVGYIAKNMYFCGENKLRFRKSKE